jgi:carbon storage regulator
MLALTRRKGESIIIGDNIEIVVLGINGDQVKLGIAAPKTIIINRKEIHEQILEANRDAALKGTKPDTSALIEIIRRK